MTDECRAAVAPDQEAFWNRWHRTSREDPDPLHREFRELFLSLLSGLGGAGSAVLELGCGQGQDAIAFGAAGHRVDATDFAANAMSAARKALPAALAGRVSLHQVDTTNPLPFADGRYSAVYAYLSLHYFDDATTRSVFAEVCRVLRPGGLFAFTVKSVNDRLYGTGDRLGPDMYCLDGHVRHFFSPQYAHELLRGWKVLAMVERSGSFVGARGVDTFLAVVASRPDR